MAQQQNSRHLHIRALCEGAILVALAQILGYIKLGQAPSGGSITPAMFPILLFALRYGIGKGLLAGFVFGLLQLLLDGAYAWGWQSMLLDYLLAFTPLGLAGLFRGKAWGIFPGTVIGCLGRFIVHFISGITIYRMIEPTEIPGFGVQTDANIYSLIYNGTYILPCMLIALVIAGALYVPMKKFFAGQDLRK